MLSIQYYFQLLAVSIAFSSVNTATGVWAGEPVGGPHAFLRISLERQNIVFFFGPKIRDCALAPEAVAPLSGGSPSASVSNKLVQVPPNSLPADGNQSVFFYPVYAKHTMGNLFILDICNREAFRDTLIDKIRYTSLLMITKGIPRVIRTVTFL